MINSNHINRINKYLIIGLVWTILWQIHIIGAYPETFGWRLINETWRSIYIIGINFLLYEFALPFLLRKNLIQKILLRFTLLCIVMMLMSFGIYAWRGVGILLRIYTPYRPASETLLEGVEYQTSAGIMSVIFFGIGVHIFNYYHLQKMAQRLRIENQAAELAFLKSQTNPHFLFNTLNNIFSLAKDKAPSAADSILRLSGIMRFMLYYGSLPAVSVKQEVELLNDYLELEKLRYDDNFKLKFSYKVENMEQQLPPLLLIPLVENAFKHGVSQSTDDVFVDIDLNISKEQLHFIVVNPVPEEYENDNVKDHIGLTNLRRQLGLLYADYALKLEVRDGKFYAILRINLISHV